MDFKPLKYSFIGILVSSNVPKITKAIKPSATKFVVIKRKTIYAIINIIFTLGSILWINELPGKNCPSVISCIKNTPPFLAMVIDIPLLDL